MCRTVVAAPNSTPSSSTFENLLGKVWPLPPLVVLSVLLPLLPTSFYLNRGFTQWFFWVSILYLLTQSKFLQKFQVLLGTSVCLGWYASLTYEYFQHGRSMDVLYKNMPEAMTNNMLLLMGHDNDGRQLLDYESTRSLLTMVLAHALDFLMHPIQTYYFWSKHRQQGGTVSEVLTWPVIFSTYLFSRLWSVTHTYYNFGTVGAFYIGHDVYVVDSLDSWYPAYITESVVYSLVVLWKIKSIFGGSSFDGKMVTATTKSDDDDANPHRTTRKPDLIYSESSVSVE